MRTAVRMSAMHAAVLRGPRDVRVEQRAQPSPGPGEAVVRVFASGLCGTDYRIWNGDRPVDYPRVMGHEFIGEVMAVGDDVTNVRPGQKVAVEPNYSCGVCALCREGNRNLCLSRTAIGIDVNGGFAEQACLPPRCSAWARWDSSPSRFSRRRGSACSRSGGRGTARIWPGRWAPTTSPPTG